MPGPFPCGVRVFSQKGIRQKDVGGSGGETRVEHPLFAHPLEKGVILRARALGLWLPQSLAPALIGEYYQSFVDEPLPLTT